MIIMKRRTQLTIFLILLTATVIASRDFTPTQATIWSTQVHMSVQGLEPTVDYTVSLTSASTLFTAEEQPLILQVRVDNVSENALGLAMLQAEITIKLPNGYELSSSAVAPQDYYGEGENWTKTFNFFFSDQDAELQPGSSVTAEVSIQLTEAMRFISDYSQLQVTTNPTQRVITGPDLILYSQIPASLLVTDSEFQSIAGKDAVYKNDPFNFTITIENVGEKSARDVYAILKLSLTMTADESTKSVGDLNADESATVSWLINPSTEGLYDVEVELYSTTAEETSERFLIEVKTMKAESLEPFIPFLLLGVLAALIIIVPIIVIEARRPKYQ